MGEYLELTIIDQDLAADPAMQAWVKDCEQQLNAQIAQQHVEWLAYGCMVIGPIDHSQTKKGAA